MAKDDYIKELAKLGKRIRAVRKARNLTQVDLELLCNINHGDISRIENGQKNIELHTIIKLARALEVEIFELFTPEKG